MHTIHILKQWRRGACLFISLGLLAACQSIPLNIDIDTKPNINPDQQGHALSVLLRLYELRNEQHFLQVSFNDLWKKDEEVLQGDMLERYVLMVNPGTHYHIRLPKHSYAKYIAAVAVFREIKANRWRAVRTLKLPILTYISPIHIVISKEQIAFH